jgi:hypothetical protein
MRTIVKQPRFEKELAALHPDCKRTDEFVAGAEWILARDPTRGHKASEDSRVWCISTSPDPSISPAVIYYTFSDTHVWLISIRTIVRNGDG